MSSDCPKVTVVTVTYNLIEAGREKTFLQCVESVKNQTYKNIEHIIIDGASTDGTVDLIKSTGLQYYSESDDGIYDAMNKGIGKATGEYINFLNSDDCFCDINAVFDSINAISKTSADWSYADAYYSNDKGKYMWQGTLRSIPFGCFPCHQTLFVRKTILQDLGGFDVAFPQNADNFLIMKLDANNYKSVKVNKNIIDFKAGGFSSSNNDIYELHIECFYNVYKDLLQISRQECDTLKHINSFDSVPVLQQEMLLNKLSRHSWDETLINRNIDIIDIPNENIGVINLPKNSLTRKYYILSIPVLKIKKSFNTKRIYLFGIVQIFKCKKQNEQRKVTLFGFIQFKYFKKRKS